MAALVFPGRSRAESVESRRFTPRHGQAKFKDGEPPQTRLRENFRGGLGGVRGRVGEKKSCWPPKERRCTMPLMRV